MNFASAKQRTGSYSEAQTTAWYLAGVQDEDARTDGFYENPNRTGWIPARAGSTNYSEVVIVKFSAWLFFCIPYYFPRVSKCCKLPCRLTVYIFNCYVLAR
jgi:hypothetical protein